MSSGVSAKYKKEQVGSSCSKKGSPGGKRHRERTQVPRYLLPAHFLPGGLTPQTALDGNCRATVKVKCKRPPLAQYTSSLPQPELTRGAANRQPHPNYIQRAGRRRSVIGRTAWGRGLTRKSPPDWCKSSRARPPLRLGAKARTPLPDWRRRERLRPDG